MQVYKAYLAADDVGTGKSQIGDDLPIDVSEVLLPTASCWQYLLGFCQTSKARMLPSSCLDLLQCSLEETPLSDFTHVTVYTKSALGEQCLGLPERVTGGL